MQRFLPTLVILWFLSTSCFGPATEWPGDSDLVCTEIGCSDRLEILVERQNEDAFELGEYGFVFTSSGDSIELDCSLLSNSSLDCTGGAGIAEFGIENSGRGFLFVFDFAPPTMGVEVLFDGELIGMETLNPDYNIFTPNGPDCEPTCFQSSEVVKVSEVE